LKGLPSPSSGVCGKGLYVPSTSRGFEPLAVLSSSSAMKFFDAVEAVPRVGNDDVINRLAFFAKSC